MQYVCFSLARAPRLLSMYYIPTCGWVFSRGQRGWEAGEQVFISYGPRSNDHLLQRYGFVEPSNPNDVYRITGLVDKVKLLIGVL